MTDKPGSLASPRTPKQAKYDAVRLLRRYDAMRKELRALEKDTSKACIEYGKMTGRWGFRPDHLRMELELEKEKVSGQQRTADPNNVTPRYTPRPAHNRLPDRPAHDTPEVGTVGHHLRGPGAPLIRGSTS